MSTEKISDRYHRESQEGVDAVLTRMCKAIDAMPGIGWAESLDVSRDTIKTWRRRGEVSMKFLTGFAKLHGLSLDYLRYGDGVRTEPSPQASAITEAAIHQAVLDAVDLLSLEGKVDAQQLAKAVVKLCKRDIGKNDSDMIQSNVIHGGDRSMNIGSVSGQVTQSGQIINHPPRGSGKR